MKVNISRIALRKLWQWVDMAWGEVSGLGLVRLYPPNEAEIYDVFLVEQESGGASTELTDEGVSALIQELDRAGHELKDLRFWWHSHGTMGTFWSGTDEATVHELAKPGWLFSLVVNKSKDYLLRFDINEPRLVFDGLTLKPYDLKDEEFEKTCRAEFEAKVKHKIYPVVRHYPQDPWIDDLIGSRDEQRFAASHFGITGNRSKEQSGPMKDDQDLLSQEIEKIVEAWERGKIDFSQMEDEVDLLGEYWHFALYDHMSVDLWRVLDDYHEHFIDTTLSEAALDGLLKQLDCDFPLDRALEYMTIITEEKGGVS